MSHDDAAGGASVVVVPDASPGSDVGAMPASDSATFDVAAETQPLPIDAAPDMKSPFADYQPITDGGLQEIKLYPGDPPNFRAGAPPETVGDRRTNLLGERSHAAPLPDEPEQGDRDRVHRFSGRRLRPSGHREARHRARYADGPHRDRSFGLKYRVGTGSNDVERDALLDAKRAVRLVRHTLQNGA